MQTIIPPRLRWACRRGMLELDVLLGNFLEEAYLALPVNEQIIFEQLLHENDQNLFNWLTGKSSSEDPQLTKLVQSIRHHARHRHST